MTIKTIEIRPDLALAGAFFVVVNGDDETARSAVDYVEVLREVLEIVNVELDRVEP